MPHQVLLRSETSSWRAEVGLGLAQYHSAVFRRNILEQFFFSFAGAAVAQMQLQWLANKIHVTYGNENLAPGVVGALW